MSSAAESATFTIDLKDGTSGAANAAADSLERLKKTIEGDMKALAGMQSAMKRIQGGAVVNVQAFKQLQAQIDAKKASIAESQSAYVQLGGQFSKSGSGARGLAARFAELSQTAKGMPGPLGGVVGRLGSLRELVAGGALTLGLVAVAAGIIAVAAAAAYATGALLSYGVAQADARRNELLRLEGLTKMRSIYGLVAGNAAEMQSAIDSVSDSVSISRDKVGQYSEQLYKMGLRGQNLTDALEGVAIKSAAQGDAAASAFAGWAAGAALTGHSVKKLSDDVKARLGGIVAKQMTSLGVQQQKAREGFAAIFSGLKIEGFLDGLKMVSSLFTQSTESGRALKTVVSALFQPLIDGISFLGPYAKRFFQGMVIAGLYLTIGILKIRNALRATFADSGIFNGIDGMTLALTAGKVAVYSLAAVFAVFAVGIAAALTPLAALGAAIVGVYRIGEQLYDAWAKIEWAAMGRAIVDGIVSGLKGGAHWVIDTIKGLGTGAMSAFKSVLGIASPSKVFARLGLTLPQGVQAGIQAGTPALNDTVGAMVTVPSVPSDSSTAAAPDAQGARGGSSSVSVSMGDVVIHSQATDASSMAQDVKRELERILTGVAISIGAPVPGAV